MSYTRQQQLTVTFRSNFFRETGARQHVFSQPHRCDGKQPGPRPPPAPSPSQSLLRTITAPQPGLSGKGGIGGIEHLTQCDFSEQALLRGISKAREAREAREPRRMLGKWLGVEGGEAGVEAGVNVGTRHVLVDEEFLPFAPHSFDLVLRYGVSMVKGAGRGGLSPGAVYAGCKR